MTKTANIMKSYFFILTIFSLCFPDSIALSTKIALQPSSSVAWISRSRFSICYYNGKSFNKETMPQSFISLGKNSNVALRLSNVDNDENDDDALTSASSSTNGFDGEGFAGYLAPYVLALIGSILVTGAFLKFVLMNY